MESIVAEVLELLTISREFLIARKYSGPWKVIFSELYA